MVKNAALASVVALLVASGCRRSSPPEPSQSQLRDGVVDMPVDSATAEAWGAAQLWGAQGSHVSVVVGTLPDGSRRVTYFLDIGFEARDYQKARDSRVRHNAGRTSAFSSLSRQSRAFC